MFGFGRKSFESKEGFHWNTIMSIIAGVLFAIGWWIIIDMSCQYPQQSDFNRIYHIIGIVATLALILANSVSNSQISSYNNASVRIGARLILFISFIFVFGSFIASVWVLFGYYVAYKKERLYPGLAIFGQNLAILIRYVITLILKLSRKENILY
ncbi:unnamed protein product [Rotaria socialis]